MIAALIRMCHASEGVTAIEYALLGALVTVVIALSVNAVGTAVLALHTGLANKVSLAIQ